MKTLTPEQFKGKYGDTSFSAPQVKNGVVTPAEPEAPKRSWMEKILGFTGGEKLAQGLGQTIAQPFISRTVNDIQGGQGDMQQKLLAAIQKGRALGQDTTRLQTALKRLTDGPGGIADTGNQAADLYNPNKLTAKQVVGDALQLGTTIASVGTYGSAASGAKTGVLLKKAPTAIAKTIGEIGFKKGAIAGAKAGALSGAGYGALSGIATGLKEDKSAIEIAKKGFTNLVEGGILGGVVGGLVGGVSGALRQRSLRKDIIKAQEKAGDRPSLKEILQTKFDDYKSRVAAGEDLKPTLAEDIKQRMGGDKGFESLVKEARKQGFSDADINFLSTVSPEDRPIMDQMFKATVKAQSDPRQITRAGDILGASVTEQVQQVQKLNQEQGALVDKAARALKGQTVDASGVLNRADEVLSNAGVTVGEDGSLNFTNSVFKKSPEIQKRIANALSDLPTGEIDGYDLHKFKKSIDEVVNYGTTGEGLRGTSANILKSIRNSADEVLDNSFEAYNAANTNYKLTRDYVDIAKGIVGKKVDLSSREGSQAFGQALRSAFSNNKSRPNTLKFIEDTHLISQKLGLSGKEKNLLDQALFVNMLEDTFGSEASTGLAGEVQKAINTSKSIAGAIRNPIGGALEGAAKLSEKFQNITPEAKKQVLRSFLSTPKAGSLADEAAKVASQTGKATRLFNGAQTQFEQLINAGEYKKALDLANSLKGANPAENSMIKSLISVAKHYME